MNTYSKYISTKEIEPNIFENEYHIFDSGSCQCYKDCNCSDSKGKFLGKDYNYHNPKITRDHDNKPRKFSSLVGLGQSMKARNL